MTTPQAAAERLLPCPFCGGEARVIYEDRYDSYDVGCWNADCWAVDGADWCLGTADEAIAKWNNRPLNDQLTAANARVEELTAEVEKLKHFAELQINGHVLTIHKLRLAIQDALYCQSLPKYHKQNLQEALNQ